MLKHVGVFVDKKRQKYETKNEIKMAKYRSNSKKDRYQPSRSSGQKKGGGQLGEVEWWCGEVRGAHGAV
jgi:hypothetical protein